MKDSLDYRWYWTERVPSQIHPGNVRRDGAICKWCRGFYETSEQRKTHETGTTPRYIIGEDRYICEDVESSGHHNDLARSSSSAVPTRSRAMEASSLEDAEGVAPPNYLINTTKNDHRSTNLLIAHRSNDHRVVSVERELNEDLTFDALEIQEDKTEDEDLDEGQDSGEDKTGSEDDELGDLVEHRDPDTMTSLFGTSMPVVGSFGSHFGPYSVRASPTSPHTSPRKQSLGFASPRTFGTARSSLASYATAPSHPNSHSGQLNMRTSLRPLPDAVRHHAAFADLVNDITAHVLHQLHPNVRLNLLAARHEPKIRDIVAKALASISPGGSNDWQEVHLRNNAYDSIQGLLVKLDEFHRRDPQSYTQKIFHLSDSSECAALTTYIEGRVAHYHEARDLIDGRKASMDSRKASMDSRKAFDTVFSSEWLAHLNTRGILLDPAEELDWSGKGQHVEYKPEEEPKIPLLPEKILGHSQTAIVESVRCRRIRLARKLIACSRQLKKEDVISEVEHLRRVQHAHIVRVVGTYTLKRHLAILLYPAADCDLDTFLNDQIDSSGFAPRRGADTIESFFGCLSSATAFIHEHNVKHLDIKPKNILVRKRSADFYKIYIADFGIARAYQSANDSETDTPVPFTRTYAAPEVVLQDKRGFSADIFSLGCVFMEMMATIYSLQSNRKYDERNRLLEICTGTSGHSAFYASINRVLQWYNDSMRTQITLRSSSNTEKRRFMELCPRMLSEAPTLRPSSSELKECTARMSCHECDAGPEPFEAAK